MARYDLDTILDFGKHRGKTVEDVLADDPGWLLWALENAERFEVDVLVHDTIVMASRARRMRDGEPKRFCKWCGRLTPIRACNIGGCPEGGEQ